MSKPAFHLSFYRWAMGLADSEPVRLLRGLACEIYVDLGGEVIEKHLAAYGDIFARWRAGGENAPGLREAMRAMGSRERGLARRDVLRERAWLQARAEVFQRTGERIPLPQSPESTDQQATAEEKAILRDLSQKIRNIGAFTEGIELGKGLGQGSGSFSGGQPALSRSKGMPEKVPDPAGAAGSRGSGTFSCWTGRIGYTSNRAHG